MTTDMKARSKPPNKRTRAEAVDSFQRWILFGLLSIVTLWVSVGSVDSTIAKPEFLVALAALLAASRVSSMVHAGKWVWHSSPADPLIALFLLMTVVAALLSRYAAFAPGPASQVTACAICFFAGSQLFREKESILQLGTMIGILSLIVCLIALFQYFSAGAFFIDFQLGSSLRVMSTLGNATYLGGFLALLLPFTAGLLVTANGIRGRVLLTLLMILMLITLWLTETRTSLAAALLSLGLFFISIRVSRPKAVLVGASLILLLGVLIFPLMPSMIGQAADSLTDEPISLVRRKHFWMAGLSAVVASPLTGHGPGSFGLVIPEFREPGYWVDGSEDIVPHAHNEFLEVAVETGIPGLLVFGVVVALFLGGGFGAASHSGRWERVMGLSLFFSLFSIFVDNLAGVSLRQPPVAAVTWLFAGILLSAMFSPRKRRELRFRTVPAAAVIPYLLWGVFLLVRLPGFLGKLESDERLLRGRNAERSGRHQVATEEFGKAVDADPLNLVAAFDLSVAQLRAGKFSESVRTDSAILALAPFFPRVHLMQSLAWLQLDSLRRAREEIGRELERRDHPESYYVLSLIEARADNRQGVYQALVNVLERNIAAYSTIHLESALKTLGEIADGEEERERLIPLLTDLDDQHPGNPTMREVLSDLRKEGDAEPTAQAAP